MKWTLVHKVVHSVYTWLYIGKCVHKVVHRECVDHKVGLDLYASITDRWCCAIGMRNVID